MSPTAEESAAEALETGVLAKDPATALIARDAGPRVSPLLGALARNPDPGVREVALLCLLETGGAGAAEAFVEALLDAAPRPRALGLRGLARHPDPALYAVLLDVYDRSPDAYVRSEIALLLGRMDGRADPQDLRRRLEVEPDPAAREGCVVALARLGDDPARTVFAECLRLSRDRTRARFLEHCRYLGGRWLLEPLIEVLDDPAPMVRVGVDGVPEIPQLLRACDLAVGLIASISGRGFAFRTSGPVNFGPAQLAEVRRYALSTSAT